MSFKEKIFISVLHGSSDRLDQADHIIDRALIITEKAVRAYCARFGHTGASCERCTDRPAAAREDHANAP